MKKKLLAIITAAGLIVAGLPVGAMAAGSASDKVTVQFSAGVPGHFDMVDETITATGDLAEKYFPEIKDNEPAGEVSFADVLVAAHIQKYGKEKVKNHLAITAGTYGTQVNKQFSHTNVGMYFVNNKALQIGVSEPVKNKNALYAGASAGDAWDFGFAFFDKKEVKVTVGNTISLNAKYLFTDPQDFSSKELPLSGATIAAVAKKTGKLTNLKVKTDKTGKASVTLDKAGTTYLSLSGKADTGFGDSSLAGALVKVKVEKLAKVKITKAKAKGKKAVLKWKKVKDANKYEVYKAKKKNGKFKKVTAVKKMSYTDKKVKKGKKYYYKVRAIAKKGGKTYKGDFSKTVKIKIKKK